MTIGKKKIRLSHYPFTSPTVCVVRLENGTPPNSKEMDLGFPGNASGKAPFNAKRGTNFDGPLSSYGDGLDGLIDGLVFYLHVWYYIYIYGGFQKWWYPTTMGFPTKNDLRCFGGTTI